VMPRCAPVEGIALRPPADPVRTQPPVKRKKRR